MVRIRCPNREKATGPSPFIKLNFIAGPLFFGEIVSNLQKNITVIPPVELHYWLSNLEPGGSWKVRK